MPPGFEGLAGSTDCPPTDCLPTCARAASGLTCPFAQVPAAGGTGVCLLGIGRAWHDPGVWWWGAELLCSLFDAPTPGTAANERGVPSGAT